MAAYRVVHVISGDLWAGAEVQVYNLVTALAAQQREVLVILFNEGELADKLREKGIKAAVVDEAANSFISLVINMRSLLIKTQADIIHTHGYKEGIVATLANLLSRRCASLRTEHGNPEFHVPWWKVHRYLQHKVNLWIAKNVNKTVVAVSAQLKSALREKLRIQHVTLIENTINIKEVQRIARATYPEYPDQVFKLACIGRLVSLKRQDIAIALMGYLTEQVDIACHLYIFGAGPEKDNLLAKIERLGIADKVTLPGEAKPLYPHLQAMDMLVMPSDHEGLPMTLLEGMALKVPVVAHAVGGIPDLLQHGKYGTLVSDHSVRGYLDAVVAAINNMSQTKAKADRAYDYIRKQYDIDYKISIYDALYQALAA